MIRYRRPLKLDDRRPRNSTTLRSSSNKTIIPAGEYGISSGGRHTWASIPFPSLLSTIKKAIVISMYHDRPQIVEVFSEPSCQVQLKQFLFCCDRKVYFGSL